MTERAQLLKAIGQLVTANVLAETRLDWLARSTRNLLDVLAQITERKAGFRSLTDACADTTTEQDKLMVRVLGGLTKFKRDLIRSRTGEGRARVIELEQRMGRPPNLTPHQQREAIKRCDSGGEPCAEIGRRYNVSVATISRLAT